MRQFFARAALVISLGAVALTGGCTRLRGHQGYVLDADLANSVQPGVDNRQSVAKVLGQPTMTGQFGGGDWYYVSRDTRFLAYNRPKPSAQLVLHIRFDEKDVVRSIDRTGLDQVASITPYGKTTPTLGRKRSFFKDIFGNIGAVGGAAGGAGGGPGGPGGGPNGQ